jgi:predicted transposase/invertase (TIGR01784 family)
MARYLDPKNDMVFKKIFGQHPHLLISFLNSQLTFEDGGIIESIEYLKDELIPDNPLKKRSVVDVRCTDNFGRQFIVEMQMEWKESFLERMLFNTAHIYSNQLKRGSRYLQLQPVYGLAILNDIFDRETSEYYHSFEMLNPRNPQEKISGMNVVLIELEKFAPKTRSEKELAVLWLRFLKEIDEYVRDVPPELQENSTIKEALDLCAEAAFTDAERYEYDIYLDAIRTGDTVIEGKLAKSRAEGVAEGRVERNMEVAVNMLQRDFTVETVSEITGMSIEETEKLKEKLKQQT